MKSVKGDATAAMKEIRECFDEYKAKLAKIHPADVAKRERPLDDFKCAVDDILNEYES